MKIFENLDVNNLNNEIWKIIKDFPDYQVSNFGRVKSLKFNKERILKQYKNNNGYLCINLYKNGIRKQGVIHCLVYKNFKNKIEKNYDVHHKDENKENNYYENLDYIKHSIHVGNHKINNKIGENNPNHKLTEEQVIEIKFLLNENKSNIKYIAEKFNVSQKTIYMIKNMEIWRML